MTFDQLAHTVVHRFWSNTAHSKDQTALRAFTQKDRKLAPFIEGHAALFSRVHPHLSEDHMMWDLLPRLNIEDGKHADWYLSHRRDPSLPLPYTAMVKYLCDKSEYRELSRRDDGNSKRYADSPSVSVISNTPKNTKQNSRFSDRGPPAPLLPCTLGCKAKAHPTNKPCPSLRFTCNSCNVKGHFSTSTTCRNFGHPPKD